MNTKHHLAYFIFIGLLLSSCGKPMANFTYSPKKSTVPTTIKFENTSKKATTYLWDFGDGATSTEATPKHKYMSSGNYEVSLKATKKKKSSILKKRVFVDAPQACLVAMETKFGIIIIELYDATPLHRDNFVKLVEEGYYDNLLFHRVISGFMIQGGDPRSRDATKETSLGSGGPKYRVPAEFVEGLVHIKGALAAARTGGAGNPEKESSGSQFYIVQGGPISSASLDNFEKTKGIKYTEEQREILTTLGGTPQLDQEYTVFGQVIEGLDVLDMIAASKTNNKDRPLEDVKMKIHFLN